MFNDTTLIAVGDSFVYGHLGDDLNAETCHARSWVSKLGSMGNFKSVVNLGAPGGCNQRSFRVLLDYLDQYHDINEKYLVIFALSELHRFEFPILDKDINETKIYSVPIYCPHENKLSDQHAIVPIGFWTPSAYAKDCVQASLVNYIAGYYTYSAHDVYFEKTLTHQLSMLNSLLESMNIKCYFTTTILRADFVKNLKFLKKKLATINYYNSVDTVLNMLEFLTAKKFKKFPCSHFDHDANEFLAKYIHNCLLRDSIKRT